MKTLLKDLFEYHNHFNQRLVIEIKTHFKALPERTFPLFCHLLNAHQIWNSRILHRQPYDVHQLHDIESCSQIDNSNYVSTLSILETDELERKIQYRTSKGLEFTNSIRDILLHVANHATHHKGQIISDFRSRNIEPIVTDYIFYKR